MPLFDRKIEIVLATHPHSDHIGGLGAVLEGYSVTQVITNGQAAESDDFRQFGKVIQRKTSYGLQQTVVKRGDFLQTPQATKLFRVSVLSPLVKLSEVSTSQDTRYETQLSDVKSTLSQDSINYNYGSIALLLRFGQVSALFMGDLESEGEQALLEEQLITDVDLLKVGHHGSKTSSTPGFLETSRPEISVISAGKNNSFGHPSPQVTALLEKSGSQIYRTDLEGTITFASDGSQIWRSGINLDVKEHLSWLSFHHILNQALFLFSHTVQTN
jgi:competence protein ComEC